MNHIQSINEFWNFFKKKPDTPKVQLDEKGWVKFNERQPIMGDFLQSTNSYRIDESGDRKPFGLGGGSRAWTGPPILETTYFKYKVVRNGKEMKSGLLKYNQNGWHDSSTREKVEDELDRMGEVYWYDFTDYKKRMEDLMDDKGYMIGLPVVVINIDRKLSKLKGGFSDLKPVYKKQYLNQSFMINTIKIEVTQDYVTGGVFISSGFGDWMTLDEVKPLE